MSTIVIENVIIIFKTLLHKPYNNFASVARVCQIQLGFLVERTLNIVSCRSVQLQASYFLIKLFDFYCKSVFTQQQVFYDNVIPVIICVVSVAKVVNTRRRCNKI